MADWRGMDRYDVSTGTWDTTTTYPSMKYQRHGFACGVIGDTIYVAGGWDLNARAGGEFWQIGTNAWSDLPGMVYSRANPVATVWNGKFYVVGGGGHYSQWTVEYFDPANPGSWTLMTAQFNERHCCMPHAVIFQGTLTVIGGNGAASAVSMETYDPVSDTWTELSTKLAGGRRGSCYTVVQPEGTATPPPAGGAGAGASAVGDPHLQNIHGERFDLMKAGKHVLINPVACGKFRHRASAALCVATLRAPPIRQ